MRTIHQLAEGPAIAVMVPQPVHHLLSLTPEQVLSSCISSPRLSTKGV